MLLNVFSEKVAIIDFILYKSVLSCFGFVTLKKGCVTCNYFVIGVYSIILKYIFLGG